MLGSQSGHGSREAPGQPAPGHVRFAPSRRKSLECASSDEDEVSLAQKESCPDFPEVSLQFWIPRGGDFAAHGGFFHDENITVLEARAILYAVRYAKSCYPLGRPLIFSGNFALVLALCIFTFFSVMRRIFASDSGQVLSYRFGGYRQS